MGGDAHGRASIAEYRMYKRRCTYSLCVGERSVNGPPWPLTFPRLPSWQAGIALLLTLSVPWEANIALRSRGEGR